MVKRFLSIENEVKKALIDLKLEWKFTDNDILHLTNLIKILDPLETATKKLGERKTDLLMCEIILKFVETKLNEIGNNIAKNVCECVLTKINSRKNYNLIEMFSLLSFSNLREVYDCDINFDNNSSKEIIKSRLIELFERLYCHDVVKNQEKINTKICENEDSNTPLMDELNNQIKKYKTSSEIETLGEQNTITSKAVFEKELELYFQSNHKTKNIENMLQALKSIPVSSIEAERIFSTVGMFLHKGRAALKSEILENIIILRKYFLEKK